MAILKVVQAAINFSASGDNVIVAAVAGQAISVVRLMLVVGAITNLTFKDGSSNLLSGALPMSANGSIILDQNDVGPGWYGTTPGNGLIINSSAAVQVSGTVWYTQS